MKETTKLSCIVALTVILISIILFTFALDSPQQDLPNYSEIPQNNGFGHGEGNPVTNQNDIYISCKKDVCNTTIIPWVTPTLTIQDYYLVAGGGGAVGSYQGGTK
jgi:hypothetical protein